MTSHQNVILPYQSTPRYGKEGEVLALVYESTTGGILEPASLLVQSKGNVAKCVGRLRVLGFSKKGGEDRVLVVECEDNITQGYEDIARDMLERALGAKAGQDVRAGSYKLFYGLDPEDRVKALDLETQARIGLGWERYKAKKEVEEVRESLLERERRVRKRDL